MAIFLVDTNHLGPALNKVSPVRDRVLNACKEGSRFATCWPVLCELEAGIVQTSHAARNRRVLSDLMEKIAIWPHDWEVVRRYGELAKLLSQRGRVLSAVDILLAVLAKLKNAVLLTTDLDFQAVPEIRTENWCSS